MSKEYLVVSNWDGDYSLGFESIEIVDESRYKLLQKIKEEGFTFYKTEWEGKHSETECRVDKNDFVLISNNQTDIEWFRAMFGGYVGNICFSDVVIEAYEEKYGEQCYE